MSLKREFNSCNFGHESESASKRIHSFPLVNNNFENVSLPDSKHHKREFDNENGCDSKRQHYSTTNDIFNSGFTDDVVRKLAFSPQHLSNNNQLPSSIIKDLEDQAYKLSDEYKNQSIVLYKCPKDDIEEEEVVEENEEEDLGPVSYYYPPIHDNFMELVSSMSSESEDQSLSPQEQMRKTGMIGVPPPAEDDHSWLY